MGQQAAGAAVMTSGGKLAVRHIIHSVPGSGNKQHLQCVENCLRKADASGLRSVSLPAFGTGGFGLSVQDSAQLTFQALTNFSPTCQNVCKVNIVIFGLQMAQAFTQEQQKGTGVFAVQSPSTGAQGQAINIQVFHGDISQEQTDAIVNLNSLDMNMHNAGALSKAVAKASGTAVESECRNMGQQVAGAAVMTRGGNMTVSHIIHSTPGSANKQHLQQCVERCLKMADASGLRSVSLPAFGTCVYGMSAQDSAELTFQALDKCLSNQSECPPS